MILKNEKSIYMTCLNHLSNFIISITIFIGCSSSIYSILPKSFVNMTEILLDITFKH